MHGSEKEVEGQPNRFRGLYQVSEVRTHRGTFEGRHPTHLMDTAVSQQQVTADFPQLNNPQFSGFGTAELGVEHRDARRATEVASLSDAAKV